MNITTSKYDKHIVLCFNSNWMIQACVLITSILHYNNEVFTFHIIGKGFKHNDIKKIQKYARSCPVKYYDSSSIDESKFVLRNTDHVTIETYYRFFIPYFLDSDINKCLYLDCDIICTNNFESIFEIDIDNYSNAMVYDVTYSDIRKFNRLQYDLKNGYFNAGVILLNLEFWRKNKLQEQLIKYVSTYPERCWFHDQDAINFICQGTIFPIKVSYNVQRVFWRVFSWENPKGFPKNLLLSDYIERNKWNEIKEGCSNPIFVHFTEIQKPWKIDTFVPFTKVWRYFLSKTEFKMKYPFSQIVKYFAKKILKKNLDNQYPIESYNIEKEFLNRLN